MNTLEQQELVQTLNYFKQKCSDLELQLVQTQIKLNSIMTDFNNQAASTSKKNK